MLTIYQASAGSGKTFNLAYEYIKLLLGYKTDDGRYRLRASGRFHHRAILAITFTNKATDEMKRRIVRELAILSGSAATEGETSPYASMLVSEFGCTPEALASASRKALVELLNDFTFFNVSTIDAFFQTVLRTFAREAELSGNFEVELSDTYAITTAVDTLLSGLADGSAATPTDATPAQRTARGLNDWIVRFMLSEMRDGRAFNLFNRSSRIHEAIIGFVTRLSNETLKRRYDEMAAYLSDPSRVGRLDDLLGVRLDELSSRRRDACRRLVDALTSRGLLDKHIKANVLNPLRKYASGGRPASISATLRRAIDNPDGESYLKNVLPDPDVHSLLADALAAVGDAAAAEPVLRVTRANLFALGILADIFAVMTQFRADNNLILLSDTNGLLADIISTDETPFIYERLGMQLRHFLIDEFQDTSRLQWDNLAPLLAESLSHDHDNLIIGDPKQSIYRFRNASPELLRDEVAARFPLSSVTRSSDTNWRSARRVVEFNNGLFAAMAANLGVNDIYSTVAQRVSPPHANRQSEVRLMAIETATATEFNDLALDAAMREIDRLLSSGIHPGDIVILTRTNPEARAVIDSLRRDRPSVPVLSDEALLVSAAPSVRLILSILRSGGDNPHVNDGGDDSPSRPVSSGSDISRFVNAYHYHIFHGAAPSEAIALALDTHALPSASTVLTDPVSVTESVIINHLPLADRRRDAPFIAAFLDLVVDYSARFGASVDGFLRWWDATGHSAAIPAPESVDAIRVMTIHKSKGLEFPHVIIPFASWTLVRDGELRWYDSRPLPDIPDELLPPIIPIKSSSALVDTPYADEYLACRLDEITDQLNATYVAFTRAGTTLTVIYRPNAAATIGAAIADALPALPVDSYTALIPDDLAPDTAVDPGISVSPAHGAATLPDGQSLNTVFDAIYPNTRFWDNLCIDDLPDLDAPRSRGIIIHDMLAAVTTADTLPRAITRVARRLNLPDEPLPALRDTLSRILAHPSVAPWFGPGVRILRERTIVLPDGTRYRPDRVVIAGDRATVIDYKTGVPRRSHAAQVNLYARYLSDILHLPVDTALLYTDPLHMLLNPD
ncbi:MAG: UvrD-helicase domain-containing protein [Pseudoflavonifractor sp.]|nr:UvrD-helicase domain-containing protein [Pseudoflavonifractor sp.]